MSSAPARARLAALAAVLAGLPSCGNGGGGSEEQPECLEQAGSLDCDPLYGIHGDVLAPTFEDVFQNTVMNGCGITGCHAGERPEAGMRLDEADAAYDALVGGGRVVPGDLRCGELVVRLEMGGKPWSMPPSGHLSEPTLCSIRHWIAGGAPR